MRDPYDISEAPEPAASPRGGDALGPLLWVLLVISLAGNVLMSSIGGSVAVGSVFGAATVACAAALIVRHYRARRR